MLMNKLKQIRPDSKMFKNINKLLGDNRKTVPELKASDGSLISNPFDKANAIAKVYGDVHRQNREMGDPDFDVVVLSEFIQFAVSQRKSKDRPIVDAMLSSKILFSILVLAAAEASTAVCTPRNTVIQTHYEETFSYSRNPHCRPSRLDRGIQCCDVGPTITVQGGLYSNYELHFVPLASVYYVARLADAMGYQNRCPTNTTFLRELDIQTAWSGTRGAIAADGTCGYNNLIRRQCIFPSVKYPFLCKGIEGTPGTYGRRLETLSYISILQGANLRWTLFVHCWRAKSPENPMSQEIATSFNVFNLDPEFSAEDRALVIGELKKRGFNTHPSNLIEFDYLTTNCS
ncbi:uncharacterized protein LOC119084461 [Bradysia coprophila]|uniref:uncharacterized protein LOC119084461 n=1 Tax=Bradysia coprophila TaxID=38358 RepID=UPI00187DD758|nr:uncharacterized protein LOC119084461 [Bradysia coprophila]